MYVDVLHTDASLNGNDMFSLGTRQLMGDVDFFPNNGDRQPGCDREPLEKLFQGRGIINAVRHMMTCDHSRSVDLLARYLEERNNKECVPMAYRCRSWEDYENGNCFSCGPHGEDCAIVGEPKAYVRKEHEDTTTRYPYYIKTTANSPLCAYQYRVEFILSQQVRRSRLLVALNDANGYMAVGQTPEREWQANRAYAFVVASEVRIRDIEGLRIGADELMLRLDLDDGPRVQQALITPMNEWSDAVKRRMSLRVCHFTSFATRHHNLC